MIIDKPIMGWNTWNTFGDKINEELICRIADTIVNDGYKDAGYNYVIIDDCWMCKKRGDDKRFVPNPEKFPHGIKYVADYVHSKGLKLGIYSCAGSYTCGRYPGSFEYEFIDAATFAEWGVDLLKYDYCFKPADTDGKKLYQRMGTALKNCGRDIVFSACSWGIDGTAKWIKSTGAHTWRSTPDIYDSWKSIKSIFLAQDEFQPYNAKGCYNDMDMLVVGMNNSGFVAEGGCSLTEYITHFSIWALLNSPLIIGSDIRAIDNDSKNILLNKDVIAINQDIGGHQPFILHPHLQPFSQEHNTETSVWFKLLDNGDYAIGIFNLDDIQRNLWFTMDDMGLNRSTGKALSLKNLWTGETEQTVNGIYRNAIEAHGCRLFRATLINE